jgi:Lrp/AsnC family transcriptional regulator
MAISLDQIDRRILVELQRDSSLSQRDLSARVGISQNACWRRLKRLKDEGAIARFTIRLDPEVIGLGVTVFVLVKTRHHDGQWLSKFRTLVAGIPEIVDFHRLAGDYDYMFKVIASDIAAFDRVYQKIIDRVELDTVTSYFSMEVIKDNDVVMI